MKLNKFELINFRRFKKLIIDFHPELTVISSKNGYGKTAVLDAATVALGTFVGAFDLGKIKHFNPRDARYQRHVDRSESEQMFPIQITATLSDFTQPIIRKLTGASNKTTVRGATELTNYGKKLMQQVRNLESVNLPVIAYYGSGRLWNTHKNMTRESVLSESRTLGYEDCFSSASNFIQVQQWMSKATFAVLQQQNMAIYQNYNLDEQIKGIQAAVNTVLNEAGWRNFHYSLQHEALAMEHEQFGVMPVSLLSDGVRAMVSLVADLAWRCAKLNPQWGANAQKYAQGMVLIDEVDMHLHPEWQQTVIATLRAAFPQVQFIVTTHSPQVLSTVKSENIRVLSGNETPEGNAEVIIPEEEIKGIESAVALNDVMGVNPIPPVEQAAWIADYIAKIENGTHEDEQGKQLRNKLIRFYGTQHAVILDADKLIRFQAFKRRCNSISDSKE